MNSFTESYYGWGASCPGVIQSLVAKSILSMRDKQKKRLDTMDVCEHCGSFVYKETIKIVNDKALCGNCSRKKKLH